MKFFSTIATRLTLGLACGSALLTGCGGDDSASTSNRTDASSEQANASTGLPDGLFLDTAPEGAKPIKELKASAEQGDEVVIRVVVGGRVEPIVEGRASAAVIDAGLENICLSEEDHCKTPWDYCCAAPEDITANLANLQVVDDEGRVVSADLSKHIKPLSTLVVRGTVGPRPDKQVLMVNATGIYIQPTQQ
jgi:hypothetical protein